MKKSLIAIMVIFSFFGLFGCKNSDPSTWSSSKIDRWFEKGEWLNGWQVKPDASVNRKEFAVSYFKKKDRWDKAFTFLKENDLTQTELRRYDIDGDNVYAPFSEYLTKDDTVARYEAHRIYADIQYVISGRELIGIAPLNDLKEVLEPYDAAKDIEFMTVNQIKNVPATPDRFFIFLPSDIHRPGLKEGVNAPVRKVVVKVRLD
jgi:YhcH/YjgK/YiaL family protein